jgi:multidrug resistance efflux pump
VLAARQAQYLVLLEQYQRRSKLTPGASITVENLDNARHQSETAVANHQQAIATRETAALNLRCVDQRGNDLHCRGEGRDAQNGARHQENHGDSFLERS